MPAAKDKELQAEIADRLKAAREALFLGKNEIAGILEISIQRWSNYERGERPFDIDIAVKLCRTYRTVSMDWLFLGEAKGLNPAFARRLRTVATTPAKGKRKI